MLRKHDNVHLTFSPGMFTGKGWLTIHIGARTHLQLVKLHKSQVAEGSQRQMQTPMRLVEVKNRTYWQFQNQFYSENDRLGRCRGARPAGDSPPAAGSAH